MPIGAIGGVASIGTRSHLTKIVGRDEIGKVLSFMSALDTLAPMVSSTFFAYLFKYTIDTYPGTVYQVTAFLVLIPIYVLMWIDIYTERPLVEGHHHKGRRGHSDENENEQGENGVELKDGKRHHKNPGHRHRHHHRHDRSPRTYEENSDSVVEQTAKPIDRTDL